MKKWELSEADAAMARDLVMCGKWRECAQKIIDSTSLLGVSPLVLISEEGADIDHFNDDVHIALKIMEEALNEATQA